MTGPQTDGRPIAVELFTEPETLREVDDVPFYEDTDVVDEETLDTLTDLDDLAVVGLTNDDGAVLVRQMTESCSWKLPVVPVTAGEEYAATAHRTVEENLGLPIELHALEGIWNHTARLEDGSRTASRYFPVFSGAPVSDNTDADTPLDYVPDESDYWNAAWVSELPPGAQEVPGTRLFFD